MGTATPAAGTYVHVAWLRSAEVATCADRQDAVQTQDRLTADNSHAKNARTGTKSHKQAPVNLPQRLAEKG